MSKLLKSFLLISLVVLSGTLLVACADKGESKAMKAAKEDLTVEKILRDNVSKDEVKTDLNLVATAGDATVTWSSDKVAVVSIAGKVVRGSNDETVKLTANLKIGEETANKEFSVKVLKVENGTDPDPTPNPNPNPNPTPGEGQTVVLSYTGVTAKMTEGNNASAVGLDSSIFEVKSIVTGDSYKNPIGLNKDGTLRLYSSKADGNGNTLEISIDSSYEISSVVIEFAEGKETPNSGSLVLGTENKTLTSTDLVGGTLTYSNLAISKFTLQNTELRTNQIWIKSITIVYKAK